LSEEIWTFCLWLQCGHSQLIDFSHRAIWHMDCSLLFNKVAREEQEAAGGAVRVGCPPFYVMPAKSHLNWPALQRA
jgi:hypothetical protein